MTPSRREFLHASAAAVALAAPRTTAATYDVLIKGGRVLDASQKLDRIADVAIAAGRIVRIDASLSAADAADVIDAHGKLVTAGLVDIHAHLSREMLPAHCLSTGVTSIVDAGSNGADTVGEIVDIAEHAPNRMRVLLNLSRTGLGGPGELLDFAKADAAAARRAIEAHRTVIVGIKARLSRSVAGEHDLDAIRRAHEVTVPLNLPLMVHVGQTGSPMAAIVARLRPGDIVTHVYSPPPNGILDEAGHVFPEVREARRRGVTDRVFDFPTVLSKFLLLGLSIDQVAACATVNAARAMPAFKGLGTLATGAPADVAVFELRQGDFEFVDNSNTKRNGRQKLFPSAVIAAGKRVA